MLTTERMKELDRLVEELMSLNQEETDYVQEEMDRSIRMLVTELLNKYGGLYDGSEESEEIQGAIDWFYENYAAPVSS